MRKIASLLCKGSSLFALSVLSLSAIAQDPPPPLSVKEFAIWGGLSPATTYSPTEGVFLATRTRIIGKIGSNHNVNISDLSNIGGLPPFSTGDIYSGNMVLLRGRSEIIGDVYAANKAGNTTGIVMDARDPNAFNGDIQANGRVSIRLGSGTNLSTISGLVAVPDASSYSGPTPAGGFSYEPEIQDPPSVPGLEPYDGLATSNNVTATRTLQPGNYGRMQLKGKATVTFSGPGNYVFDEIGNSGDNIFIFDLKGTEEGAINIFVVKNALIGSILVRITNDPATKPGARIYTEVHGAGSSRSDVAFSITAPSTVLANHFVWLGNVWVPNGSITVGNLKTQAVPHIRGSLWAGKRVQTTDNFFIEYQGPAGSIFTTSTVIPYYTPPIEGKVFPEAPGKKEKIGAELTSLAQDDGPIKSINENEIFIFTDALKDRVMIEVVKREKENTTLLRLLRTMGFSDEVPNGPHEFTYTGS
ncbi:MAG TPA: hypothetical protein VK907_04780, partial [Phnomibacter sp.]|nr:hypothetical protein [Phnomibacter sp.]